MPKMNVLRTNHINAAPGAVFSKLNDLSHWTTWSPWLIMEQGVEIEVRDNGKFQRWEGDRVGAGNMQITSEVTDQQVNIDLTFLKPWKSKAKIVLLLGDTGDGTIVTWTMESKLPFFLFWMKKRMSAFIGMDFERGLRLLKDYVEEGTVNSKLEIVGLTPFEGAKYLGINSSCSIDGLAEDMHTVIRSLLKYIKDNKIDPEGEMIAVYHKWDLINRKVDYDTGYIIKSALIVQAPFFIGELPKATVHTVRHTGDYNHLGNAWSLQQMMLRRKEFKGHKNYHPFEIYRNDPNDVPKSEIITEICFSTK